MVFLGLDLILRAHGEEQELKKTPPSRKVPRKVNGNGQATVTEPSPLSNDATRTETVRESATVDQSVAGKVYDLINNKSKLISRFRLEKVLGAGNTGIVALAYDHHHQMPVAAKFHLETAIEGEDGDIPRRRVDRVAKLQNSINSPHALKFHMLIKHNRKGYSSAPCWVTIEEYIDGDSLGRVIRDHNILIEDLRSGRRNPEECVIKLVSEDAAITIAIQLAGLLSHAWERAKIVHRDIKPDNIMIKLDVSFPGGMRVVLVDFGIARSNQNVRRDSRALFDSEFAAIKAEQMSQTLTLAGHVLGTPHYMSPEQVVGERVDQRTDIYCLAATLYHLVTGYPPLDADNLRTLLEMILLKDPAPATNAARSLGLKVSEAFSAVLAKAMAKEPEKRYQTMDEFALALQACREPQVQKPSSNGGILSRFFGL